MLERSVDLLATEDLAEKEAELTESPGSTSDILKRLAARGIPQFVLEQLSLLPIQFFLRCDALTDEDLVASGVDHSYYRCRILVELQNVLGELAARAGVPSPISSKSKVARVRPQSATADKRKLQRPQSGGGCARTSGAVLQSARIAAPARPRSSARARRPAQPVGSQPTSGNIAGSTAAPSQVPLADVSAADLRSDLKWRWPFVDEKMGSGGTSVKQPVTPPRPQSGSRVYGRHRLVGKKAQKRNGFIPLKPKQVCLEAMAFVEGPDSPSNLLRLAAAQPEVDRQNAKESSPSMPEQSAPGEGTLIREDLSYIDADSWLQYRLMPSGPLAVIEGLQHAAAGGDVESLRAVIQKVEAEGPSFVKSLDSQQASCRLISGEAATHNEGHQVPGLWSWACYRLDELTRAESELAVVVDAGLRAVEQARRLAPAKDEAPCHFGSLSAENIDVDTTSSAGPATWSLSAFRGSRRSSWAAVKNHGLFKRSIAGRLPVQADQAVSTASFLSSQRRLAEAMARLRFYLRVVDKSVALEGNVRTRAGSALTQLQECQDDLFDRFVQFRQCVELELVAATEAHVDGAEENLEAAIERLQAAITAARHEAGAKTLIGAATVEWAETCGIGIYQNFGGDDEAGEPPSPWVHIEARDHRLPPWQAAYAAAVTRLQELRARMHVEARPEVIKHSTSEDFSPRHMDEDFSPRHGQDGSGGESPRRFARLRAAYDSQEYQWMRNLEEASMLEAPAKDAAFRPGVVRRGAVVKRASLPKNISENVLPKGRTISILDEVNQLPTVEKRKTAPRQETASRVEFSHVEIEDTDKKDSWKESLSPISDATMESSPTADVEAEGSGLPRASALPRAAFARVISEVPPQS